jgi:hypothetical protein
VIRASLRFAEQAIPAPNPIKTWENFWEYLASARRGAPVPRPTGHNPDVAAYARVDDGRWIADCPWQCGASFNLPRGATWFWCTECAGAGWGTTAALVWPDGMEQLTRNLESLPTVVQFWPCEACKGKLGAELCLNCRSMQGLGG